MNAEQVTWKGKADDYHKISLESIAATFISEDNVWYGPQVIFNQACAILVVPFDCTILH